MKTKIYNLLIAACCVLTGLTSCLELEEPINNMPKSIALNTYTTENESSATSLYLSGSSYMEGDDAYFLVSMSSDMSDAERYSVSGWYNSSRDLYHYSKTVSAYPNTTYYYQFVVDGHKTGIAEITTKSPYMYTSDYYLSAKYVTLNGYSDYHPMSAFFRVSKNENMSDSKSYNANITYTSYSRYRCTAEISDIENDTQYYYRFVIVYRNGKGEDVVQEGDVKSFHTASYMQIESLTCKDFYGNVGKYDEKVTIVVVPSSGSVFQTNAYPSGSAWKLDKDYAFYTSDYTVYAFGGYIEWYSYSSVSIFSGQNGFCYYGKQTGLNAGNNQVKIEMTNPLAQVVFQLNTKETAPEKRAITSIACNSYELSSYAVLNMANGTISNRKALGTFSWKTNISLKTTPTSQVLYLVPASISSTGTSLTFTLSDGTKKTEYLKAMNFEAGKSYTVPVTLTDAEVSVGDIYVTPWENVSGGQITVQ